MKRIFNIALIATMTLSIASVAAATKDKSQQNTTTTQKSTTSTTQKTTNTTTQNVTTQKVTPATTIINTNITTTQFITDIKGNDEVADVTKRLTKIDGVEDVAIDLKSKIVTVKYDKRETSDAKLLKAFKKAKVEAKVK